MQDLYAIKPPTSGDKIKELFILLILRQPTTYDGQSDGNIYNCFLHVVRINATQNYAIHEE
jgi:hypothetical protein